MLAVSPVRAFSDNYIWLIRTPGDPSGAAVVDPGEARQEIPCAFQRLSDGERVSLGDLALDGHPGASQEVRATLEASRELRSRDEATLPSTIGLETRINAFLRCREPSVRAAAEAHAGRSVSSAEEVFAVIRSWKDGFR